MNQSRKVSELYVSDSAPPQDGSVPHAIVVALSPAVRLTLDIALRSRGFNVLAQKDSVTLVETMARVRIPDLLVLSWHLARTGMLRLAEGLSRLDRTKNIPVLLVLHGPEDATDLRGKELSPNVLGLTMERTFSDYVRGAFGQGMLTESSVQAALVEMRAKSKERKESLQRDAELEMATSQQELTRERQLLGIARAALGSGLVDAALAALRQHEKQFLRGSLAREREDMREIARALGAAARGGERKL